MNFIDQVRLIAAASAPQAALWLGEPWGMRDIITVDMGGTSFDITLTRDGRANVSKNIDFLRYRIGIPMIQVETLGAGGGSIGWIDSMGLMQMGPQSAGSEPGPACYGKGGTMPTTTEFTRTLGAHSTASVAVRLSTPALAAL